MYDHTHIATYRHLRVGNVGSEYDYWLLEGNECSAAGGFPSNSILSGSAPNRRLVKTWRMLKIYQMLETWRIQNIRRMLKTWRIQNIRRMVKTWRIQNVKRMLKSWRMLETWRIFIAF